MIDVAEKGYRIGDSTKMNIRGFGKICNLNKIDVLITDSSIDNETKAKLEVRHRRCCCRNWLLFLNIGVSCDRNK
jgi:DeoR/GlpR family transcriptional regulator of sugar metabolism